MKMIIQFLQDLGPDTSDISSLLQDLALATGTNALNTELTQKNVKSILQDQLLNI